MNTIFAVIYINIDSLNYSELLGLYNNKEEAVLSLLEKANYREKNGRLTQYMRPTNEYESFNYLKNKVSRELELNDVDIYRIIPFKLNSGVYLNFSNPHNISISKL